VATLKPLAIPGLSAIPLLGPLLFRFDIVVYLTLALAPLIRWWLSRSKSGLVLRTIGETPENALAIGYPVRRIRLVAILFGGAMAGLGGAYLSVVYVGIWVENMTAGRGWIALSLMVFAA
jgi:simple sugar transport system permease protein